MKQAAYALSGALFGLFSPSVALAEVCDKVKPLWTPTDGPVTFMQEAAGGSIVLVSVGLAVFAVHRWRWPAHWMRIGIAVSFVAVFSLATFGMLSVEVFGQSDIWLSSVREGCRSGYPVATICFGATFALSAQVLGYWFSNRPEEPVFPLLLKGALASIVLAPAIGAFLVFNRWIWQP